MGMVEARIRCYLPNGTKNRAKAHSRLTALVEFITGPYMVMSGGKDRIISVYAPDILGILLCTAPG